MKKAFITITLTVDNLTPEELDELESLTKYVDIVDWLLEYGEYGCFEVDDYVTKIEVARG